MQKIIIATLLFTAVLLNGCFPPPLTENQNANANTATSTAEEIDTSDWKTYRNEEFGFEFRYPETMSFKQSTFYTDVLFNDSINLNLAILDEALDPESIKSLFGVVASDTIDQVDVGGRLSYRFKDGDAGVGGNSYRIPLDLEHTLLMWFVNEGGYYSDYERKITSSFKFTK